MGKNQNTFHYIAPSGGVVCFPKLKIKIDSKTFCSQLLKRYDVSLLPGFAFSVDEYFRLNFGIKSETFKKALELIQEYIDETEM